MAAAVKPGWSKPSTILFASEIPANEKTFAFALAQAAEFGADLIIFHAYDTLVVSSSDTSGIRYYDYAAAARCEFKTTSQGNSNNASSMNRLGNIIVAHEQRLEDLEDRQ